MKNRIINWVLKLFGFAKPYLSHARDALQDERVQEFVVEPVSRELLEVAEDVKDLVAEQADLDKPGKEKFEAVKEQAVARLEQAGRSIANHMIDTGIQIAVSKLIGSR